MGAIVRTTGRAAHSAYPEFGDSAISRLVAMLAELEGLDLPAGPVLGMTTINIGSISGGHTENVIPEGVKLTGTLRFTTSEIQEQIHTEIKRAFEVARALGGNYELKFEIGSPPMSNDANVSALIEEVGKDLLGTGNVHEIERTLGAEDFGSFLNHTPGAMFTLGVQKKGHEEFLLHQQLKKLPARKPWLAQIVSLHLRRKPLNWFGSLVRKPLLTLMAPGWIRPMTRRRWKRLKSHSCPRTTSP